MLAKRHLLMAAMSTWPAPGAGRKARREAGGGSNASRRTSWAGSGLCGRAGRLAWPSSSAPHRGPREALGICGSDSDGVGGVGINPDGNTRYKSPADLLALGSDRLARDFGFPTGVPAEDGAGDGDALVRSGDIHPPAGGVITYLTLD